MKKYILALLISWFLLFDNVIGYTINNREFNLKHLKSKSDNNIEEVCVYTDTGYFQDEQEFQLLIIYHDNSAYYNQTYSKQNVIRDNDYVNNWDKNSKWDSTVDSISGLSNEGKLMYSKTGKCPDVMYRYEVLQSWYFFGYDENLEDGQTWDSIKESLDKWNTVVSLYKLVEDEVYNEDDVTTCDYGEFFLEYTKSNGVVRKVDGPNESFKNNNYIISESYRNDYNLLDTKKCPVVFRCVEDKETYVGVIKYTYSLYVDELVAEQKEKGCSQNRYHCKSGEYCDPSYKGICPKYEEKYRQIKLNHTIYQQTKNKNALEETKQLIDELKVFCKSITEYSNYDTICMEFCLNYQSSLEEEGIISNSMVDYTFSNRLIVYFRNILRWIKYIIPVVVIALGILDFIKAIGADKDDEMKKAQKKFIIRLISAALIFIIPLIIEFVLGKMGFGYNDYGLF